MSVHELIQYINNHALGWPLIIFVLSVSALCTVACSWVQFRYFFASWKFTLFPETTKSAVDTTKIDMTPFQAFVNALSTSLGNGAIAGMGFAVFTGGPGAAFWVVVVGLITMSVRFAEVFLSTYYGAMETSPGRIGGPMLYLKRVGGEAMAYFYAIFLLIFGLVVGNAIQANSIQQSLLRAWNIAPLLSAIVLGVFMLYVVFGGAPRIVKASNAIVPLKVGTFFLSSIILLGYHYQSLFGALKLIIESAFTPVALAGGLVGASVQMAMRVGMLGSINATEAGLGTTAVLFGNTGSKEPVKDGIISMLSTFIGTLVCFMVALCIVASGVWANGLTGAQLTMSAFETVFGSFGSNIVTFLSVTFGIGVAVSFAYITREAFLFLTGGKFRWLHPFLYCAITFSGALVKVNLIWDASYLINAILLVTNLIGIVYLLPVVRKNLLSFMKKS